MPHQLSPLLVQPDDDAVVHDVDDFEEQSVVEDGSVENGLGRQGKTRQQKHEGDTRGHCASIGWFRAINLRVGGSDDTAKRQAGRQDDDGGCRTKEGRLW